MRHRAAVLALVAALAATASAGCESPTAPEGDLPGNLVLPEPSTNLDPSNVVLGPLIATQCHVYRPERVASGAAAFVDIYFFDGERRPEPPEFAVAWVEDHGGVVVHRHNVNGVRAAIYLDDVPAVTQLSGNLVEVREVPDAARYDVPVIAIFEGPVVIEEVQRFRDLGGRIEWYTGSIILGVMPDRSMPALRAMERMLHLSVEGTICPAGDG